MANKPKAKPRITAREKKARESRRAFERICDRIEAGEGVKQITADKKASMTERNFYYMLRAGDDDLFQRYARARDPGRPDGRSVNPGPKGANAPEG